MPARRRYDASAGEPLPWASRSSIASSIRMLPGGVSGTALRTAHGLRPSGWIGSSCGVPHT